MTISPPSKVKYSHLEPFQVLASGVDTLYLSIDVTWKDESFFEHLAEMKSIAVNDNKETTIIFKDQVGNNLLIFRIYPHGYKGHEWVLRNEEYSITIGKWLIPQSRPSIMLQIFSETLWHYGPHAAIDRVLSTLSEQGATFDSIKPSRVDLCVDFVLPVEIWGLELIQFKVSRSNKVSPEIKYDALTGLIFGKGGSIVARLYDKPAEIVQVSKKFWMYDIWEVDSVPDEYRIIRVESQFRREAIKQFGFGSIESLFLFLENLWAYFSQEWLKFQDNPSKHHTQRKTFGWWVVVQNGFFGVQEATPLIRCKALSIKEKQLFYQAYGLLGKLTAIRHEKMGYSLGYEATIDDSLKIYKELASFFGKQDFEFSIDVLDKRGAYEQSTKKMLEVNQQRRDLGHPCNLPVHVEMSEKYRGEQWKNI